MNYLENIEFRNKALPITIVPRRTSVVDKTSLNAFHEAVEIKYFIDGESTLLVGTKTVHAKKGDVIVINPYEFHTTVSYGNENKGRYHLFMIGLDIFEGLRCSEVNLRGHLLEKRMLLKTSVGDNQRVREILERLVSEYEENREHSEYAVLGLTAELFCELIRESKDENTTEKSFESLKHYAVIEPALRMIRDGFSKKFTVDDLAVACNLSKFHFCRIFKHVMGMGAIQYLNSFRLKIADALLKSTALSVGEIASFCGFDDLNYFSRIYKSAFGSSPKKAQSQNVSDK